MATVKENKNFVVDLLPANLLDDAIAWIASNLEPEDVFSFEELEEWAKVRQENQQ